MNICSFFPTQQNYADVPVRFCKNEQQVLCLIDLHVIKQLLEEDEPKILQRILSPAEHQYFQRFKYMKRKKEWLGGRIAAKAALFAFLQQPDQDLRSITILPNKHGRPIIEHLPASPSRQAPTLSLTHSDGYALALVRSDVTCGLDLQEISTKLAGLTTHFATETELQLLADQLRYDEDTRLTMLWTVKEALKKAVLHDQSVIFSETELQETSQLTDSTWRFLCKVQGQQQSVLVYLLPPYILSITEKEEHA